MIKETYGSFINIEGSDGSGKTIQVELLDKNARVAGFETALFDYPNYPSVSSVMVQLYLGGKLPKRMSSPEAASIYYAQDRNANADEIKAALKVGKLVISNRFTPSNMAHQGTKIPELTERKDFYKWAMDLEFNRLKIPKPDVNIVLMVDAKTSMDNVTARNEEKLSADAATRLGRDAHENIEHLTSSVEVYRELCELYTDWFTPIESMVGQSMRPKEEIAADVWAAVKEVI